MTPDPARIRPSRRQALKTLGAVVATVGIGSTTAVADQDTSSSEEAPAVTIEDQSLHNGTVYISEATLPEDGFVALHNASSILEGPVLGVSAPLTEGSYSRLPIELDEYPDKPLTVAAIVHRDTPSDGVFTFPEDGDNSIVDDGLLTYDSAQMNPEFGGGC
ncbi:Tat (twin-arginine translocation) pathway signal sequence [Halogranum rubrum]|uniref:Tat (Twin-arginine translocation) pathway signal sequence n=1 Tax=Halogranum rubrum TaxID=553466 RepID=A0A1I4B9Y1_9EURY|nr:twin-arginine translocation signal domain-containing protein [Halogranum rubrum]SFK65140.1 Tat (twin-arginine translocation) pathway signal sequence [Halogranum rubrum]